MNIKITAFFMAAAFVCATQYSFGQTTAMDFNRKDCHGNNHHLFADLDSGKVVILEFFMQNCTPCITAGHALEPFKSNLLAQHPGKIKSYAIGFSDAYSCASNMNWVNTNGFTSIPLDSGGAQVAYYGGFGMPTIVVLGGGMEHRILGNPYIGFSNNDTTKMKSDITTFFNGTTGINEIVSSTTDFQVFPNPAADLINLKFKVMQDGLMVIDIIDIDGKQVNVLTTENVNAGMVTKSFSTAQLANGSYFIRINVNGTSANYKLNIAH